MKPTTVASLNYRTKWTPGLAPGWKLESHPELDTSLTAKVEVGGSAVESIAAAALERCVNVTYVSRPASVHICYDWRERVQSQEKVGIASVAAADLLRLPEY